MKTSTVVLGLLAAGMVASGAGAAEGPPQGVASRPCNVLCRLFSGEARSAAAPVDLHRGDGEAPGGTADATGLGPAAQPAPATAASPGRPLAPASMGPAVPRPQHRALPKPIIKTARAPRPLAPGPQPRGSAVAAGDRAPLAKGRAVASASGRKAVPPGPIIRQPAERPVPPRPVAVALASAEVATHRPATPEDQALASAPQPVLSFPTPEAAQPTAAIEPAPRSKAPRSIEGAAPVVDPVLTPPAAEALQMPAPPTTAAGPRQPEPRLLPMPPAFDVIATLMLAAWPRHAHDCVASPGCQTAAMMRAP